MTVSDANVAVSSCDTEASWDDDSTSCDDTVAPASDDKLALLVSEELDELV